MKFEEFKKRVLDIKSLAYGHVKLGAHIKKLYEDISIPIEPPVKPAIADTTNITMWVDMIWNDIFDDDELDFNPRQMNIIGKYVNDAKEKIRKQFSV